MALDGGILIVAGTRPELIKLAPVFEQLKGRNMPFTFIWSGQHYDYELSRIFIKELQMPEPDFNLDVGSGSHATQTAKAMVGVEEAVRKFKPALALALGDTNTVAATALSSVKIGIPFVHVESGLRSWDETMPEEINRKIADHVAQLLFTPSALATTNVLNEGVSKSRIFHVGNTVIDVLFKHLKLAEKQSSGLKERLNLDADEYFLATFHRQENVDNPERLRGIIKALIKLSKHMKIVIPSHPRTKKQLIELNLHKPLLENKNIVFLDPLGYFEFLGLLNGAKVVLTDSGGVQEEAFTLKVPTITLRYNTERPETILLGCNVLAGADEDRIVDCTHKMVELRENICSKLRDKPNPYGDGHAGEHIANVLEKAIKNGIALQSPDLRDKPLITYNLKSVKKVIASDEVLSLFDKKGKAVSEKRSAEKVVVRNAMDSKVY